MPAAMLPAEFRTLLEGSGLTHKQAAELLGVSVLSIGDWRLGYAPVSAENARLIRERLKPEPSAGE